MPTKTSYWDPGSATEASAWDPGSDTEASAWDIESVGTATWDPGAEETAYWDNVTLHTSSWNADYATTTELSISGTDRDGMQTATSVERATGYVFVGKHNIGSVYNSCFQFKLNVDQGTTISSSFLNLYAGTSTGDFDMTVTGEDIDTAVAITESANDITGRTRTTASADWTAPTGTGGRKESPELSAIIQEVVDRAGWQSGNFISILVMNKDAENPGGIGEYIQWRSYDQPGGEIPLLSVSTTTLSTYKIYLGTWDQEAESTASGWDPETEKTAYWDMEQPWRTGWGHGTFAHVDTGPHNQKDRGFGHGYRYNLPWDLESVETAVWDPEDETTASAWDAGSEQTAIWDEVL